MYVLSPFHFSRQKLITNGDESEHLVLSCLLSYYERFLKETVFNVKKGVFWLYVCYVYINICIRLRLTQSHIHILFQSTQDGVDGLNGIIVRQSVAAAFSNAIDAVWQIELQVVENLNQQINNWISSHVMDTMLSREDVICSNAKVRRVESSLDWRWYVWFVLIQHNFDGYYKKWQ